MEKIMLIGIGWEQLPLLEKVKSMGLKSVVTTTWDIDKLDADIIYEVDSRDLMTLEKIFLKEKPDAILADECDYSMYAAAFLTEKYNLPGPSLYALTVTNNKFLQRELASKESIKQPRYTLCWNYDMALKEAKQIGFPVIIKPVDNRGSIGVFTANTEEELKSYWYISVANAHSRMCIVEEFIDGEVVTVEGFFDSYNFNFLAIATKNNYENTKNVAKLLFYPGKITSDGLFRKIKDAGEKIVKALNICYGFVHIEFIISNKTKEPFFIEAANRGGGVHISNIVLPHITGVDLVKKSIKMSLGKKVKIDWDGEYVTKALMFFLNPDGHGDSEIQDIIAIHNEQILAVYLKESKTNSLNNQVRDAVDRAGVVILTGSDFERSQNIGLNIEKLLKKGNDEFTWRSKNSN